jgi:hypothetical protein
LPQAIEHKEDCLHDKILSQVITALENHQRADSGITVEFHEHRLRL